MTSFFCSSEVLLVAFQRSRIAVLHHLDRSTRLSEGSPTADVLVIIPTYNEAENILIVLEELFKLTEKVHVLVVDDNSPDGTADQVRRMQSNNPDHLFLNERTGKKGLGSAYREGFQFALERGYSLVAEMDADRSHNPADLPDLLRPLRNDQADFVIGSRYHGGVRVINWPLRRLVLSYSAGVYTRAITQLPVKDVTAGYNCFYRTVLESLDLDRINSNGYSFQIELKYRAWRKGFRLKEVPVIFTERTEGQSKMSKGIVREAALKVWELRFRDLLGRL